MSSINIQDIYIKNILENIIYNSCITQFINNSKIINKILFIENIEFLRQIFYIEYDYYKYNSLPIHNKYNNKILSTRINRIIFDYKNYKKESKEFIKTIFIPNLVLECTQEECIYHTINTIKSNITIFDFMNKKI